ncbi:hypothetical protein [Sphingomonas sp. Leaf67]|uniref:hypothetical protein n=1 Tax=Sphingomonas sp. Leaf67 TaxID=1736230 RepID=UPI00138EFD2A|nr:hypothetical protein [Sphingomonas sp. Leaf67]
MTNLSLSNPNPFASSGGSSEVENRSREGVVWGDWFSTDASRLRSKLLEPNGFVLIGYDKEPTA